MSTPFDYSQEEWVKREIEGRVALFQMELLCQQLEMLRSRYDADLFSEDAKFYLQTAVDALSEAITLHGKFL